ncbi:hypothetical protein BDQ17DRAFT_1325067 [Cyathus striatus]|nr:hypothetical protein BDQ17DRAFT_1325067 [Cyathus striatus]
MLFSTPLVLLVTLAGTLVSAAPALLATDAAAAICDQPKLSPNEKDWSTAAFITANSDKPLKHTPIFWSGNTGGVSVLADAEKCTTKVVPQGYTVGMMMCQHGGFTMPSNGVTTTTASQLWDTASRVFAQNTVGKAFVTFGQTVNPQGTWARVEFPALQANTKVTSVLQIDPNTCGTTCYWLCKSPAECTGLKKCANAP